MPTTQQLPPGPTAPRWFQTLNWQARPIAFFEHCRERYGKRFTIRLLVAPTIVFVSDPDEIKEVFTAPADALHPGEGAAPILAPLVGANSVIVLDEGPHMTQRKLMLPAFHGERMKRLTNLMTEVVERELASWPTDRPIVAHPQFQALTLEVILRAVFGLEPGPRLDNLRTNMTELATEAVRPLTAVPALRNERNPRWREFVTLRDETDRMLFGLIDERRAEDADRNDVLSMLLDARHEDGSPMSSQEVRDELMTLMVAGHETTAASLAWAFERLVREPRVVARLQAEIDSGDGDAYLTATIHETLRARPVLPNAAPRLVKQPVELGGIRYEPDPPVCISPNAYLVHHDPDIYDEPYTFRPERFLDNPPGTYTWIPFGGGRRRCLGASFALMQMRIVLRAVLERRDLRAGGQGREHSRRRSITITPSSGALTLLPERAAKPAPVAEPAAA